MFKIVCITIDENNNSVFTEMFYKKEERLGMLLSEAIGAKKFRLRESKTGYTTNWHLSGDATLISILKGTLRITLQNKNYLDFKAGDLFIAADNLPENILFDPIIHGHKAEVVGNESLFAIHIKLDNWKI
jgi:hypothetical protein